VSHVQQSQMKRPKGARKTAGSKSKSTISHVPMPEMAHQEHANGCKNIAGVSPQPTLSICGSILRFNLAQTISYETDTGKFVRPT
jgi:hypothetical protein